ncbi:hypothetical protein DFH06DRAFT_1146788 [Mycena polygramma]|nr:hypothetical protein DFH06DRAFT_1146788 [Mycena polygramma]
MPRLRRSFGVARSIDIMQHRLHGELAEAVLPRIMPMEALNLPPGGVSRRMPADRKTQWDARGSETLDVDHARPHAVHLRAVFLLRRLPLSTSKSNTPSSRSSPRSSSHSTEEVVVPVPAARARARAVGAAAAEPRGVGRGERADAACVRGARGAARLPPLPAPSRPFAQHTHCQPSHSQAQQTQTQTQPWTPPSLGQGQWTPPRGVRERVDTAAGRTAAIYGFGEDGGGAVCLAEPVSARTGADAAGEWQSGHRPRPRRAMFANGGPPARRGSLAHPSMRLQHLALPTSLSSTPPTTPASSFGEGRLVPWQVGHHRPSLLLRTPPRRRIGRTATTTTSALVVHRYQYRLPEEQLEQAVPPGAVRRSMQDAARKTHWRRRGSTLSRLGGNERPGKGPLALGAVFERRTSGSRRALTGSQGLAAAVPAGCTLSTSAHISRAPRVTEYVGTLTASQLFTATVQAGYVLFDDPAPPTPPRSDKIPMLPPLRAPSYALGMRCALSHTPLPDGSAPSVRYPRPQDCAQPASCLPRPAPPHDVPDGLDPAWVARPPPLARRTQPSSSLWCTLFSTIQPARKRDDVGSYTTRAGASHFSAMGGA